MSTIEWTDLTWNPVTGCTKVSPGCKHCYAERMAKRLKAMGNERYSNGFEVTCHEEVLRKPLRWRKPRRVFVNSMSDLFHEAVPLEFIQRVFRVMEDSPQHQFQVLTKRSERLAELAPVLPWPENVWMGVSVESEQYRYRADHLRGVDAKVRFLSVEPLVGRVGELDLTGLHWIIVGGESGPGARPLEESWVTEIRDQCVGHSPRVPFFFKQWGGTNKKKTGRELEGRTWDEMPR